MNKTQGCLWLQYLAVVSMHAEKILRNRIRQDQIGENMWLQCLNKLFSNLKKVFSITRTILVTNGTDSDFLQCLDYKILYLWKTLDIFSCSSTKAAILNLEASTAVSTARCSTNRSWRAYNLCEGLASAS